MEDTLSSESAKPQEADWVTYVVYGANAEVLREVDAATKSDYVEVQCTLDESYPSAPPYPYEPSPMLSAGANHPSSPSVTMCFASRLLMYCEISVAQLNMTSVLQPWHLGSF